MANGFYDIQEPGIIADSVFPNRYYIYWRCGLHHTAQTEIQWLITKTVNGVSSTQEIKTESVSGIKDDYQKAYVDITSDQLTNATNLHVSIYATSEVYYTKQDGTPVYYWGGTRPAKDYTFGSTKPSEAPNVPDFTITNATKANVSLTGISTGTFATGVRFEIYKKEYGQTSASFYKSAQVEISNGYAYADIDVDLGAEYTARAAFYNSYNDFDANGELTGIQSPQWSDTENGWAGPIKSAPLPVENFAITTNVVSAGAAVNLDMSWDENVYADTYEVQYIDNAFSWTLESKIENFTTIQHYYTLQLQNGGQYKFRIRAINNAGESSWKEINIVFGLPDQPPTIWSDETRQINSGSVHFYWKHNPRDSAREISAEIDVTISTYGHFVLTASRENQDEKDWYKNSVYIMDTAWLSRTSLITWKVRTAGPSGLWSEWSVEKTIELYGQPGIITWTQPPSQFLDIMTSSRICTSYPIWSCVQSYEGTPPAVLKRLNYFQGMYDEEHDEIIYDTDLPNHVTAYQYYPDLMILHVKKNVIADWLTFKVYVCGEDKHVYTTSDIENNNYIFMNPTGRAKYFFIEVYTSEPGHDFREITNALDVDVQSDVNVVSQDIVEARLNIYVKNDHVELQRDGSNIQRKAGELVYTQNALESDDKLDTILCNYIDALKVNFTSGQEYTIEYVMSFISGYVATSTYDILWLPTVNPNDYHNISAIFHYDEEYHFVTFEINVERTSGVTGDNEEDIHDFYMNAYRINKDGSSTQLSSNIEVGTVIGSDIRASLRHPKYVISVTDKTSGHITILRSETNVQTLFPVIQWGKSLKFDVEMVLNPTTMTYEPVYSVPQENTIVLVYNLDINETRESSNSLASYAGRVNPLSYYGEARDEKYTWNVEVPVSDTETMQKFRDLAVWNDKCYIRHPHGDGYWANVSITITTTHDGLTNKISMNITKIWSLEYN